MFFYSYCGKTPFHADVVNESIIFLAFGLECITCLVSGMACHLIILFKQTRIESAAGVYMLKNNRVVSSRRHQRNIVSFMGHFVSFILTILQFALLLNTYYFFVEDVEILATMRTLVFFPLYRQQNFSSTQWLRQYFQRSCVKLSTSQVSGEEILFFTQTEPSLGNAIVLIKGPVVSREMARITR